MKNRKRKRSVLALLLTAGCAGCLLTSCGLFEKDTDDPDPVFNTDLLNIALTEIHYNPADNEAYPSDSLEFLEVKNVGSVSLPLTTLEISGDINYSFPEEAILDAGSYYVIASNATAFEQLYGFAPNGVYIGQLSNNNGTVTLRDVDFKEIVFSQFYSDSGAWSGKADGDGYSLVAVETNPDPTVTGPDAWRKSARINGSPMDDDVIIPVDSSLFNIKITEIHYNPLDYDGIDGDSLEFIELKNVGAEDVAIGRCAFTNGIEYQFAEGSTLGAGETVVLVSHAASFSKRYSEVTPLGEYSGKLSNSGEKITLFDLLADVKVTSVDYKDNSPWPSEADGEGASLVAIDPAYGVDQDDATQWRASFRPNGSPGVEDPGIVILNEVLTHTDTPLVDAVELYNPGAKSVDISGWYISDSKANPAKYRIPDGNVIPAGGYLVFDALLFNADTTSPLAFTFNSHGESAWLFSHELGCAEGFCDGVSFDELDNGVSIGRYRTSTGKDKWVRQSALTLGKLEDACPRAGAENAGPRIGPLIISEIMYHSTDDAGDFIEVTNISGAEVVLSHPDLLDFTWKISGIGFSFPANTRIKQNESVVIASDSLTIDAFKARYTVADDVQVFQMTGDLQNGSEKLELLQPADPYVEDPEVPADSTFPYVEIDKVDYSDNDSWPQDADGLGASLQRVSKTAFGNDVVGWASGDPNPGTME